MADAPLNSPAPVNASFYSDQNLLMKIGTLESDVKHLEQKCTCFENRIQPLETWKTEVIGGWKWTRWLIGIGWLVVTFLAPVLLKYFGLI